MTAPRCVVNSEVPPGERDRRFRQVDAEHPRAAAGEPHEVGANAAPDFDQTLSLVATKIDHLWQIGELVESVIVELVEKRPRPDRLGGHFQVVDPLVPVGANAGGEASGIAGRIADVHRGLARLALT